MKKNILLFALFVITLSFHPSYLCARPLLFVGTETSTLFTSTAHSPSLPQLQSTSMLGLAIIPLENVEIHLAGTTFWTEASIPANGLMYRGYEGIGLGIGASLGRDLWKDVSTRIDLDLEYALAKYRYTDQIFMLFQATATPSLGYIDKIGGYRIGLPLSFQRQEDSYSFSLGLRLIFVLRAAGLLLP